MGLTAHRNQSEPQSWMKHFSWWADGALWCCWCRAGLTSACWCGSWPTCTAECRAAPDRPPRWSQWLSGHPGYLGIRDDSTSRSGSAQRHSGFKLTTSLLKSVQCEKIQWLYNDKICTFFLSLRNVEILQNSEAVWTQTGCYIITATSFLLPEWRPGVEGSATRALSGHSDKAQADILLQVTIQCGNVTCSCTKGNTTYLGGILCRSAFKLIFTPEWPIPMDSILCKAMPM